MWGESEHESEWWWWRAAGSQATEARSIEWERNETRVVYGRR